MKQTNQMLYVWKDTETGSDLIKQLKLPQDVEYEGKMHLSDSGNLLVMKMKGKNGITVFNIQDIHESEGKTLEKYCHIETENISCNLS